MIRTTILFLAASSGLAVNNDGSTHTCQPCGSSQCVIPPSHRGKRINTGSTGFGFITCGEIQNKVDRQTQERQFTPPECSAVEVVTLPKFTTDSRGKFDGSDPGPCGCVHRDGSACLKVPESGCSVCPFQNQVIGDPNRIVVSDDPSNPVNGIQCSFLDLVIDAQGDQGDYCSTVQRLALQFCKCYDKNTEPRPPQCILEQNTKCNPNVDACCDGACVYRRNRGYVCSTQPADPNAPPFSPPSRPGPSPSTSSNQGNVNPAPPRPQSFINLGSLGNIPSSSGSSGSMGSRRRCPTGLRCGIKSQFRKLSVNCLRGGSGGRFSRCLL